jgi:hypothetical protein
MLQNAVSRLSSRREVVVMGVVKLLRPLSTQPVAEQSSAQLYRTNVNTVRFVSQWRSPPHFGSSFVQCWGAECFWASRIRILPFSHKCFEHTDTMLAKKFTQNVSKKLNFLDWR